MVMVPHKPQISAPKLVVKPAVHTMPLVQHEFKKFTNNSNNSWL